MGLIKEKSKTINADNKQFISKNLDISQQVFEILERKGWKQKNLAQALGKSESEISKLLSGLHNLTLKSITQLEVVLESDIITTPKKRSSLSNDLVNGITFYDFKGTTNFKDMNQNGNDAKIIYLEPLISTLNYKRI
ncbi:helix-turn-helix transcriptional regulator [Flavobacterium sp.]|jgi:transcriptional regulator with XRE-family HTH domain|uniref:helix-turn-helix domain-containing protein n=1 Tax=Flavobacterium sp. TaxID=239 RepID=UPI0025DF2398|nr:helix-turn-helix transcriptional regulator [Flavobacterium sp.]